MATPDLMVPRKCPVPWVFELVYTDVERGFVDFARVSG